MNRERTDRHEFLLQGFSPIGVVHFMSGTERAAGPTVRALDDEILRLISELPRFDFRAARLWSVFVHTQFARTRGVEARLAQLEEVLGIEEAIESPQLLALHRAFLDAEVVSDLDARILRAPPRAAFVISDDPVVCCNQFAQQHPRFRNLDSFTGLAHKGLQLFLPLSSEFVVALFDSSTYAYPEPATFTLSHDDVWQLNALQAMHAEHALYFRKGATTTEELGRLRDIHDATLGWRTALSPAREPHIARLIGPDHRSPRLAHCFDFAQLADERAFDDWIHQTLPVRRVETLARLEREFRAGPDRRISVPS